MDLGTMSVKFAADTSGLSGGLGNAASMLSGFAQTAGSAFGPVGEALAGIATVAIGVGAASIKLAGDFQESMDKVQAYAGLTKTQTDAMSQSILAMAPALGQTPKALADGLYFVASAGFKGADALNVLKYAGMTAAASNVSATVTSSALVAALNGLGLKGKDAGNTMDILNATVSDGVLSWDDYGRVVGKLASSFVGTGESAKQMHTNFIDANAGLDLFTNAGVSARLASTNLSSTINILENKTDSIAAHAKSMGISFDESKFKTMDLQHQMAYLGQITDNNSGEMIKLMGGNSGAAKTIDFLNANSKKYGATIDDITNKMRNGQTTQDKFNVAQEGFNFQMARAGAAIQVVGIKIGTLLLPVMGQIMGFVTPLISGFGNLIAGSGGLGSAMGGLSTMLQPVGYFFQYVGYIAGKSFGDIKDILFQVQEILQPVADSFQSMGGGIQQTMSDILTQAYPIVQKLGDGFHQMAITIEKVLSTINIRPFLAGIADAFTSISGVIGQFVGSLQGPLQSAFTQISGIIGGVFTSHMKTAQGIIASLSGWFKSTLMPAVREAMPGFQSLASVLIGTVVPGLMKLWAIGQKVVDEVLPPLVSVFEAAAPVMIKLSGIISTGLAASLKFLMPYILQGAAALGQFAGEIATRVAPIAINFFHNLNTAINVFMAVWKAVWPYLAPILKGVWDEIVGVIKVAWAIVSGIVKIGLDLLSGNWGQAWTDVKDMLSGVWDGIKQIIGGGIEIITGDIKAFVAGIVGFFQWLWDTLTGHSIIPDMVHSIISWFGNLVSGAIGWIQSMVTIIKERITVFTFAVIVTVQSWVNNIIKFFGNLGTQAASKISDMISTITGLLNKFVGGAANFGATLIKNFASGITGAIGNVTSAIGNVVGAIGNFLPHSPAKEGELSHLNEYGPSFIKGLSEGLLKSKPMLEMALTTTIAPMAKVGSYQSSASAYPSTASYSTSSAQAQAPVIHNHFHVSIDGQQLSTVITPHVMNEVVYQARSHKSGGRAA